MLSSGLLPTQHQGILQRVHKFNYILKVSTRESVRFHGRMEAQSCQTGPPHTPLDARLLLPVPLVSRHLEAPTALLGLETPAGHLRPDPRALNERGLFSPSSGSVNPLERLPELRDVFLTGSPFTGKGVAQARQT